MTWHATYQVNRRSTLPEHRSTEAVYDGDRRSMVAVNDSQRHRTTGQQKRSTTVIDGQWRRSTTIAGGGPSLTIAIPPLTAIGPLVIGG
uniref:Uncharacterized protein n=1 Tax=Tanacetum cinerariifolium TaxID=118510 RepID=A0A6L2KXN0_TANCI|nr:hypothetical protein [Tanacetum cinerariifolium]